MSQHVRRSREALQSCCQEAGRANTDFSASITQTNMTDLTDYAENNKNLVLWEVSIVQEYCNRGSLRNALQQGAMPGQASEGGPPGMECCLLVAEDVACGMNHIHSMQICHGDLKAHNILLTSQERDEPPHIVAKVADFGLSVLLNTEQTHVSGVNQGTVTHMAPEILMSVRAPLVLLATSLPPSLATRGVQLWPHLGKKMACSHSRLVFSFPCTAAGKEWKEW